MKRILVTAGGTATAWHIVQVAKEHFVNNIEIQICDTNEPYLVPAVVTAKKVHRVPPVVDEGYVETIGKIVDEERIDCILPLIPQEAYLFARDSDFVREHGIDSTAPTLNTTNLLADKFNMYRTLCSLDISTPKVYGRNEIDREGTYLLKPRLGFGSAGVEIVRGGELDKVTDETVIQEYCHDADYDEITVEVNNGKAGLHIFARRRIATKAGVCVKMEPVDASPIRPVIKKLINNVECPKAFNVQFLWHNGEWKLFDCNLRLGAGTALSTAIGFQLTRALLAEVAGDEVEESWFNVDKNIKTVLRVYQEIAVR